MGLQLPKRSGAPVTRVLRVALLGVTHAGAGRLLRGRHAPGPQPGDARPGHRPRVRYTSSSGSGPGSPPCHRRHRLGPDLLRRGEVPPPQRRRDPGADALQPAARDLLHDRPGHDGASCSSSTPSSPERRARRLDASPTTTVEVVGQQWSWTFNYGSASRPSATVTGRRLRLRLLRLHVRHRRRHPDAGAAGRRDHPVQPLLARRDPLLRGPGFLMKMDVIPGRDQPLPGHPDRRGHLRRQVLRALRRLPLADALQRRGRQPGGVRRLPPRAGRRRATPPSSRCSAATTPTTQAGLDDDSEGAQRVSAAPQPPRTPRRRRRSARPLGQQVVRILTTTDHKLIGKLYLGHVVRLVPGRRPDGAC